METNTEEKEGFWSKKEGTWGMAGIGIIAVLMFLFWGSITAGATAAFIAFGTTFGFMVAKGIVGLLALAIIHGLFIDGWLMLWYQAFCTNMRQAIIDEHPLTILKMWMDKAMKRMKEIREGISVVAGQKKETEEVNESFKRDFVEFQKQANYFEGKEGKESEFRSACGKMARAAEMITATAEDLRIVTESHKKLTETYKELEIVMEDMKYEESALIRKFKTSGALDMVWGRMRTLFKGDSQEDLDRAAAIKSINTKYAERMGRVETAMTDCQGKLDDMKTKREIREVDGMAMFNQLKNASVDQLSSPKAIGYNPVKTFDAEVVSNYSSILNKK